MCPRFKVPLSNKYLCQNENRFRCLLARNSESLRDVATVSKYCTPPVSLSADLKLENVTYE